MRYDVAVAGLGGIGSAVLAHCASRGASAIGFDQLGPISDLRASSGGSRIIRKAYFEDPAYVPLLRRAYDLWSELEREAGEEILHFTGLLTVGEESSEIVAGTRRSAEEHNLAVESLSRSEIQKRYPSLVLLPEEVGLFEKEGGALNPERAIGAQLNIAEKHGARMRFEIAMENWNATDEGVDVLLADGTQVSARKLVLALGPWFKQTLESLGIPIRVQRNVQAWFSPTTEAYNANHFPAFLMQRPDWPAPLYGFPDFGNGVKAAFHGFGELTDAEHVNRKIDPAEDVAPLARALEQWMPRAARTLRAAQACMYTLTPDERFVVDHHPEQPNVILCGGFSGHGFKFSPVIGEIGADLALNGESRHSIDFLSVARFAAAPTGRGS